jgi:AraC-like DNA-binding protein
METYNLKKMQELLHDFYYLTKIKICIYDHGGNELCFYPEKLTPFCALLRKSEVMDERCRACDRLAFSQCRKTHRQYVYTCHAGLLEGISPILYDDQIIGYIAVGQIKADEERMTATLLEEFPPDERKTLSELYRRLPVTEPEKITSAMRILDACTGYEYLKGLVRNAEKQIDLRIAAYVNDHLNEELSVRSLCSEFHLSHSEIYTIFREYFNATPAEYIKSRRLSRACRLLKETDLAVSEIARRCGIPDYNYFSKIFKRTFETSPREYRKGS